MMVLILGGTSEADQLAALLSEQKIKFTYSLAGVTPHPKPRDYPTRTGGFGGVDGLAQYLRNSETTVLIDATHPFASNMSANAVQAATRANVPMLRLERPAWDDNGWQNVASLDAAADILPAGATVFLSVGSQSVAPFAHRRDVQFISRAIKPPPNPFGKIIVAKPPFDVAGETMLFKDHAITHLVSKNAGGDQTSAKLTAAQILGIRVIMVERPILPVAETVNTPTAALAWITQRPK
ncbi:MAG: cobalt-precorrin-6A reductase [Rhodobacteraceae bacterium]|nr:cobalt-precorrin-6A reductase [Paracoccaceae bacterium]